MMLPRLLYVTDFQYEARGRTYADEDRWLTSRLADHFRIELCDQPSAESLMAGFDGVVVRNSGPAIRHQAAYDSFRAAALTGDVAVFNELTGMADMVGKQYLVDLSRDGAAVIPTIDRVDDLERLDRGVGLGSGDAFIVKPKFGSDSIGMSTLIRPDLTADVFDQSVIVQPLIDFVYEVSFVFVDDDFQYAVVAPDPQRRWEMRPFVPSVADLEFAQWFISWNRIRHGIQRVDACRAVSGELMLMELEDHNPYLSLGIVDNAARNRFVDAMRASILHVL